MGAGVYMSANQIEILRLLAEQTDKARTGEIAEHLGIEREVTKDVLINLRRRGLVAGVPQGALRQYAWSLTDTGHERVVWLNSPTRTTCEEVVSVGRTRTGTRMGDPCRQPVVRRMNGEWLCGSHAQQRKKWRTPGAACMLYPNPACKRGKAIPAETRAAFVDAVIAMARSLGLRPDPATWDKDDRQEMRERGITITQIARLHDISPARGWELIEQYAFEQYGTPPRRVYTRCVDCASPLHRRAVAYAKDANGDHRPVCGRHAPNYTNVISVAAIVAHLRKERLGKEAVAA